MIRETSIDAYHFIKENGLLVKRKWEIYNFMFNHGPLSCRQAIKLLSQQQNSKFHMSQSYSPRFCELRDEGYFREVEGGTVDPDTRRPVILWDVTSRVPEKIEKKKRHKCEWCLGKGYYEDHDRRN